MSTPRGSFGSKAGFIAAATGSAIGLGNIWRFPYVAGENGGAAFIFIYLLIILCLGIPVLMSEFVLGRKTNQNVFGAFRTLAPGSKWHYIGVITIVTSFLILSFYNVVSAWTLVYLKDSITNSFAGISSEQISGTFDLMVASGWEPIAWVAVFIILTLGIVSLGVEKGIERFNKILMPMLFVILIGLCINSFTLSGYSEAISFLFSPDFSKITPGVVLSALGQAFFSLSLGMGTMMTYGSYVKKSDNLFSTSISVASADLLIAILAGIAIFPAVFSFNIEPTSGPDLVFKTLPNIFAQMTGGYFVGILFFMLLVVAAITSSVSIFEVLTSACSEEFKISRRKATILISIAVFTTSTLCSLSLMPESALKIGGKDLFTLFDVTSSTYLLPIGALFIIIYTGWFFKERYLKEELSSYGLHKIRGYKFFYFIVKYIAPLMIIIVFLSSLGII